MAVQHVTLECVVWRVSPPISRSHHLLSTLSACAHCRPPDSVDSPGAVVVDSAAVVVDFGGEAGKSEQPPRRGPFILDR